MKEESYIVQKNNKMEDKFYDVQNIKELIYTIRGKQVMIDSDVAMLYHYTTKRINEAVNRNRARFPENFCFQLTEAELEDRWSQIATASKNIENKFRNKKYLPYVFTENVLQFQK